MWSEDRQTERPIFTFFDFSFCHVCVHKYNNSFFVPFSFPLCSVVKSNSSSFLVSLNRRGKKHNREEGEKEEDKEEEEEDKEEER